MPHFDYLILHGKGVHASHASLGPITFHLVKGKPLMLVLTSCVVHVQPSLVYEYDVINIILMIFWNKWLPNACQIRLDVRKITVMLPRYILWHIQENFWHLGSISNETYGGWLHVKLWHVPIPIFHQLFLMTMSFPILSTNHLDPRFYLFEGLRAVLS